jgi:hypothetical protein
MTRYHFIAAGTAPAERENIMHYELWGAEGGNRLAVAQSEDEAFSYVRSFLSNGWSADDLSLGIVPAKGESSEGLETSLTGATLRERASRIPA